MLLQVGWVGGMGGAKVKAACASGPGKAGRLGLGGRRQSRSREIFRKLSEKGPCDPYAFISPKNWVTQAATGPVKGEVQSFLRSRERDSLNREKKTEETGGEEGRQ